MSFNFMKKSIEELKQDLLNKEPVNWEQMQDADQSELAELNRQEYLEELKQLREDNPTEDDYLSDVGMSRSDFL
jgi:acetoin utilization deacetylase AcuC-like enzyme|tara:strand:- start:479 stop:700 length:222 start_codon:yes stop_codon:yes gene_type:complete